MFDSITLFRIIKTGFVNYWRNIWLSAAATMVMVITLVIFSALGLLFGITKYSIASIKDRVDISVYFKPGIAESLIHKFTEELKSNSKVQDVSYVSAKDALDNFKTKHSTDQLVLDSLDELSDNPLPATVQVKATTLEDYPALAKEIQDGPYKDQLSKVNFEDNRLLIERLGKALHLVVVGGTVLVAVFSIIAILVIFNTITLTIYNRREEVEIMRLVGATNTYIRGPFLVEALLYSVVASLVTGCLVLYLLSSLKTQLALYVGVGSSTQILYDSSFVRWPLILGGLFAIAVILSVVSSTLAIRKYLKV
jgi:cell division transport system permease protein